MSLRHVPPNVQRAWAEEVLFLHALWHQGPPQNPNPNPSPSPNLRPTNSTDFKKKRGRGRRGKKIRDQSQPSNPPPAEVEWPVNPTPDPDVEPAGWPDPILNPRQRAPLPAAEQARASALWVQQTALKSCRDFFSKDGSDGDEDMSEDEEEEKEEESKAFEFFLGFFENDGELRGYYEKNYEKGEFLCLVCGGTGVKLGKRYGDCIALVQHSTAISKTKRRGAHRGFGRAVCRVLGWDIKRLPSIVLDLKESQGQSLVKAAKTQDDLPKEDGTEIVEIPHDDVQKEDSNGDLMDCTKANETEIPIKEGVNNEKEELVNECGKHLEESNKNNTKDAKKKHLISSPSNPPAAEIVWPCEPSMGPKPGATSWEDLIQASATTQPRQLPSIEEQVRATAAQVQQNGLKACRDFLARPDGSSSSSDDVEDDEEEMKKRESLAFKFFLMLFKMDPNLRNYYEKNCQKGEFCCLVCGGIGMKTWKRFGSCLGLVQHSKSIANTKRRWAHRAFGRAVCQILGWDINGNSSIDAPRESQAQLLEKSAESQDGTREDGNADCLKEATRS